MNIAPHILDDLPWGTAAITLQLQVQRSEETVKTAEPAPVRHKRTY
ncbi:MAG: hypothetical protein OWR62_10990 [Sulfobacillus thermotolerans]|nr:hypothetical protein [Sulfobacillus thermotolerans]